MTRPYNDVDLHAFVDGQVGPDRRAAISRYLETAPRDAARVGLWKRQNEAIRAMFSGPEHEPVPLWLTVGQIASGQKPLQATSAAANDLGPHRSGLAPPRLQIDRPGSTISIVALLAFFSGVLVAATITSVASTMFPSAGPAMVSRSTLVSAAFDAYDLFLGDPDHAFEVSAASEKLLQSWLATRVGTRLPLPDLAPQGWALQGGRIATGLTSPAAVLVYANKTGQRLMLYMTRIDQPVSDVEGSAPAVFTSWSAGSIGYALVTSAATTTAADLRELRTAVRL